MIVKERQKQITTILRSQGVVTASKLAQRFGVSPETIRRDLLSMEKEGLLTRAYGGAMANTDMMPYRPLKDRDLEQSRQKDALARNAAALVQEGDYIAIGTGSTPIHFAQELKRRFQKLTVVTYSLRVFELLRDIPGFQLILPGGTYIPEENALSGQLTLDYLDALHVQKAFVFPSAISIEHGICGYEQTMFPLQRKLLQCCDQVYILADSSKFEHTALYKISDMRQDYIYVTDPELPQHLHQLYTENGYTLITEDCP